MNSSRDPARATRVFFRTGFTLQAFNEEVSSLCNLTGLLRNGLVDTLR